MTIWCRVRDCQRPLGRGITVCETHEREWERGLNEQRWDRTSEGWHQFLLDVGRGEPDPNPFHAPDQPQEARAERCPTCGRDTHDVCTNPDPAPDQPQEERCGGSGFRPCAASIREGRPDRCMPCPGCPDCATDQEARAEQDWTCANGRSNSSPEYLRLVEVVAGLIRDEAPRLIAGQTGTTARLIVAQLAHKQGMVPASTLAAERIRAEKAEEWIKDAEAAAEQAEAERDDYAVRAANSINALTHREPQLREHVEMCEGEAYRRGRWSR